MRVFLSGLFILALTLILSGCQGFLDDYKYNPVAAIQSNPNP